MTASNRPRGGTQLSDRDRAVLATVGQLRLATSGQLQRLFFRDSAYGSSNARIARRVLQRLTDLGLLHRLKRRVGGLRAGSSSYTFALKPAGAAAIGWHLSRGQRQEPSLTFVVHTLAVAEVVVRLQEARRDGQLESLEVQTEPRCWRDLTGFERLVLKPDLFISAGLGDTDHLAWVEIDLGSEHGPALIRKAKVYERYFRSGREQQRLGGSFPRVVWLVPDDKRAEFVRRSLARARELTPGLHRVGLLPEPVASITGSAGSNIN